MLQNMYFRVGFHYHLVSFFKEKEENLCFRYTSEAQPPSRSKGMSHSQDERDQAVEDLCVVRNFGHYVAELGKKLGLSSHVMYMDRILRRADWAT